MVECKRQFLRLRNHADGTPELFLSVRRKTRLREIQRAICEDMIEQEEKRILEKQLGFNLTLHSFTKGRLDMMMIRMMMTMIMRIFFVFSLQVFLPGRLPDWYIVQVSGRQEIRVKVVQLENASQEEHGRK